MSDWPSVVDEEITCNAKYGKDGDYDGLDDERGELLQGLLIHLPHLFLRWLVFVGSIPGAVTCGIAGNKFNGSQIAFTQVLLLLILLTAQYGVMNHS